MTWWLRSVGILYLVMFILVAILRLPIKELAPPGTLDQASAGEPISRFLVDTWMTLGLEYLAIGAALLLASRIAERAAPLVWTVLAIELVRGIGTDLYMLARGYAVAPHLVWVAVHAIVITSGIAMLRRGRPRYGAGEAPGCGEPAASRPRSLAS